LLGKTVVPYLKVRFPNTKQAQKAPSSSSSIASAALNKWARSTETFTTALPVSELFPLIDMWRLAVLDPSVAIFLSEIPPSDEKLNPLTAFLDNAIAALSASSPNPRNYLLTLLRLLSNSFACAPLGRRVAHEWRTRLTPFLITTLLHADAVVRTSAASLVFNLSAFFQNGRVESVRKGLGVEDRPEDEGDWEMEMVSAVVEAIDREKESEDVVHRLTASLAFLVCLSPSYESVLGPLLEVLQARAVLLRKLDKGGCGPDGVSKIEVRKLVDEVANKLCP